MGRLRHRPDAPDDDPTGLAGWLYTDLMLGLVVVFLGSVTFMTARAPDPPAIAEPAATTTTTTTTTTTVAGPPPDPCSLQTDKHRIRLSINASDPAVVDSFNSQLNEIILASGLPADTRVGFSVVFGGGNDETAATALANRFFQRLLMIAPDRFGAQLSLAFFNTGLSTDRADIDVFLLKGTCP
ncbi:unannotated protein [freshwater metagenome]|uniref:Unannotated protein n=1 Tax=freshwater metagenome TaxID=449393 RepID=A0A6J7EZJ6_9ZZZZ|nr:hypothetical protein [Actinomycetota bacterium]